MVEDKPMTATEVLMRRKEWNNRYQERIQRVFGPFINSIWEKIFDLKIDPRYIPRTTTREEWKVLDHWRRTVRRRVQLELEEEKDKCPDCGGDLTAKWSGVECENKDCGYWFCY